MTDRLFDRALVLTDFHFGRSGNNAIHNQDLTDFLEWAIDRALGWGVETCIFCGDFFDNRHQIGIVSLDYALKAIETLNKKFQKTYIILGNHDVPYRESRASASIEFGRNLGNVYIIRDPITVGDVTMLPWLVGDERKILPRLRSRYIFGHLETMGAMMNAKVVCSSSDAVKVEDFIGHEYVFSGHFHKRQFLKCPKGGQMIYIGSAMCHNFSDADDTARGAMFLQWGCDPVFEAWPEQPLYHATTLSKLLDNLAVLRPHMTVRAAIDIDLHYDEAQEMRETLMTGYGLRKLELSNAAPVDAVQADTGVTLYTVDQIVIDGLRGIESAGLSSDRLIDIFTNLPRH